MSTAGTGGTGHFEDAPCGNEGYGKGHRGSALQLTREVDYAVRVMMHMASLPEETVSQLPELAKVTDAPKSFLSKVLQTLCRAGLVSSQRGSSGGFQILPEGRKATIASICEAVDGPWSLNVCLTPGSSCSRMGECAAHSVWAKAQRALLDVLRAHTVQELAAQTRRKQALVKL